MKIIQSFWAGRRHVINEGFGWYHPRFHALSWVLSCLQLSKYYEVELYTDQIGYDFLIKELQLPYKKVYIILDELNDFSTDFWALPKIKTYTLQSEPYLHIDGDVFIWEAFPEDLMASDYISQNLEITTEYYHNMWTEIYPQLDYLPIEMNGYVSGTNNLACNMGIFGGNDTVFLKKYANKSFEFASKNKNLSAKINASQFNMFFEQVLFQEMITSENKTCGFLINEISHDNDYKGFGDFYRVPHQKTYLHLLGVYKRNFHVCKMLESYVMLKYPEYFKKITTLFEDYQSLSNHTDFENLFSQDKSIYFDYFKKLIASKEPIIFDDYMLTLRDLVITNEYYTLYDCIKNNKNKHFCIIPCFQTMSETFEDETHTFLKIQEINNEFTFMPIDDIDETLFNFFKTTIDYPTLINKMVNLLDEEAFKMKEDFIDMVNDRLSYYFKHKLILIY